MRVFPVCTNWVSYTQRNVKNPKELRWLYSPQVIWPLRLVVAQVKQWQNLLSKRLKHAKNFRNRATKTHLHTYNLPTKRHDINVLSCCQLQQSGFKLEIPTFTEHLYLCGLI